MDQDQHTKQRIEGWQLLVHVCRQWRCLVFGSPRRLNLRLSYTPKIPAVDILGVWPALPLVIQGNTFSKTSVNNILGALGHSNRVFRIDLDVSTSSKLEKVLTAMQVPFPELIDLGLRSVASGSTVQVLSDSFLGGFAPRLQYLCLFGIPYPGAPKILLSATRLVGLRLWNIPHSGYISPEVMVTCLSALTSLEIFWLGFESPQSCPGWEHRRPPPSTRSLLPSLTLLRLNGASEYVEDLVAHIYAPKLKYLDVTFFNQIVFNTPQLILFINCTPSLKALKEARVAFAADAINVIFPSPTGTGQLNVEILCKEPDWQLSALEQVCTPLFSPVSMVENLYICEHPHKPPDWKDNIEDTLWLETLHPFTAVKNLFLSEMVASLFTPALKEITDGKAAEVLPALQNLFMERSQYPKPSRRGVWRPIDGRQSRSAGHPFDISPWNRGSEGIFTVYDSAARLITNITLSPTHPHIPLHMHIPSSASARSDD